MPPIVAFKLPILLSKPLDNQLLTLYLIRSNPHKKPYDPNYSKKARKRSKTSSKSKQSIKPHKSFKSESSKSKPTSKSKDNNQTTSKFKPDKSNSNFSSKSKPLLEYKNVSKSRTSSTSFSKILSKSRSLSTTVADKSTSQVLSIPSTSSATSTQYKNVSTSKTTTHKKKASESSRSSTTGTTSTSRSDSTTPRTPLKSNVKLTSSNYPSPSPPKPKQLKKIPKEPKVSSVSSAFGGFKIPKKPKVPSTTSKTDEKSTIPKRLQPSGYSPIDSIIGAAPSISGVDGSRPSATSTPRQIESIQSRESQNIDDDLDPLETDEPELGFDLYGAEEPISQQLEEDFISQNNDPLIREENGQEEAEEKIEEAKDPCVDDPMDQSLSSLPRQSILKQLDDDSESSDDEGNFKRRGVKDKADSESEMTLKQKGIDQIIPPTDSSNSTQSTRSRPIPINQQRSTPKVISLRPPSSSRPQIPVSLSPPRHLPSPSPSPPPPPPSSSSLSSPSVQSVIAKISSIESPDDAMKKFLEAHERFPRIFAVAIPRFQTLFRNLLLSLFRDVNFMFNQEKFTILLNQMRQLGMDESNNWEEIICSWGRNYQPLLSNQAKLENMIKVITHIYNHLQSNKILINLPTAGLLYEMKMVKMSDH